MESLRFDGAGWEYFKIWIVNILLVIVTIGLYYPWAKVRNRRYFYANSTLEGRNFEYHATGKQLFLGYIITIILFIVFVSLEKISIQMTVIMVLLAFIATPWVIWRSFKFNLRMTSFSNVRFSFSGKLGGAYLNYLVLPLLFFIALFSPFFLSTASLFMAPTFDTKWLAILMPVVLLAIFYLKALMSKKNTEYAVNHCQYGQGQFVTRLDTNVFVMILLKTFGLALLVYGLILVLGSLSISHDTIAALATLGDNEPDHKVLEQLMSGPVIGLIILLYFMLILSGLALLAFSITRQRRYIYSQMTFDDKVTFNSSLTARSLFTMMLTNFILVIVTLGLAIPWAKVRMARLVLGNTQVDAKGALDEYITQQQDKQSSLGDQIGDAFDIGVDLAI